MTVAVGSFVRALRNPAVCGTVIDIPAAVSNSVALEYYKVRCQDQIVRTFRADDVVEIGGVGAA